MQYYFPAVLGRNHPRTFGYNVPYFDSYSPVYYKLYHVRVKAGGGLSSCSSLSPQSKESIMESTAIIILTIVALYIFWGSLKTLAKGLGFTTNEVIGSGSARVITQCRKVNKATMKEWEDEDLASVMTGDELLEDMMKSTADRRKSV